MSTQLRGRRLIAAMCVGQVGNLLPHVALSAILAQHLMPLWHLSAGEGGLIASGYAFGYMLAVPVLTTLTDRIDARKILMVGSIVSGLATIGFGLFAQGFWSAIAIWTLAGIGFAGAYMPGLKSIDRPPSAGRFVACGDTLHVQLFLRRWLFVFGRAARGGCLGLAISVSRDRHRADCDDGCVPRDG
jgi:MFS family permease